VTIAAQVPKDLYADVALRLSAHDLIDAFFATGVPGVTQQILLAIAGGYQPGVDTINAFFDGGIPEVVQAFLIANGDPNSFEAALINGFFDGNPDSSFEFPGIPEPTRLLIQAAIPDGSAAEDLVDAFFLNGGLPGVVPGAVAQQCADRRVLRRRCTAGGRGGAAGCHQCSIRRRFDPIGRRQLVLRGVSAAR
jgi:hypothetical protein